MSKKLFYMPLEGYKQRYTHQWSAPQTGWLERRWIEHSIPYERIDGVQSTREIKVGSVVDGIGRSTFCFSQIEKLLLKMEKGEITNDSVIYFDDFWHPGIEAIPYACHLLKIKPKIFTFCHAQSVDEYDFTRPMIEWIRPFEKAFFNILDGMFVCCPRLRILTSMGFSEAGWNVSKEDKAGNEGIKASSPLHSKSRHRKIHVTGHPFAPDEVLSRMPNHLQDVQLRGYQAEKRKNQVVWSSRWDWEKNPLFFLQVAKKVLTVRPDTVFVVCTSAEKLKSNKPELVVALQREMAKYPSNFILKEGLSKEEYYAILAESKIQFNCALQDWVAITLLEATTAGCYPIYPFFRSFPETFLNSRKYTYDYAGASVGNQNHTIEAADKIISVLSSNDLWTTEQIHARNWVHDRFKLAWAEQIRIMGMATDEIKEMVKSYDPYDFHTIKQLYPDAAI